MKNFNPIKKLTSGLISLGFGSFMIFIVKVEGMDEYKKIALEFLEAILPIHLANIIVLICSIYLYWFSFKSFISGGYKVLYFNQFLETFDSGTEGREVSVRGNDNYRNINRILEYREAKMSGMNSRDAADFMRSTSFLNTISSGSSGRNSQRALDFVESRMAGMSGERGIQFLQGHIK